MNNKKYWATGIVMTYILTLIFLIVLPSFMGNDEAAAEPTIPVIYETTEPATEPTTEEVTEAVPEPTSVPVTTEPALGGYTEQELEYLAIVIYREAGADYICDECRRRVGDIVLNRVESDLYPDTIYDVLMQKQQYGNLYWTGVVWPSRASADCERHAVERAYRIAEEVLTGQHSDVYGTGWFGQAERSVFEQNYSGHGYVYCCGIYFFSV